MSDLTREEAIQVLKTALTSPLIYGEYADAIGMAIEAMTDRPYGRLIDADALYTKATELWDKSDSEDFEKGIFKLILNAPTVSSELNLQTPQTYGKSINPSNAEVVEGYISKADAIDAVTKLCVDGYKAKVDGYFIPLTDALINTLSALPSAEAEWIPCSERLPSVDGRYLVTYPLLRWQNNWISVMYYGKPLDPTQDVKGKCFYYSDSEWGDVVYDNILAWMPLPKPYREDGE